MANIPRAREILAEALEYNMDSQVRTRIEAAMQEMYRVYENGRSPEKSRKMTRQVADEIIAMRDANPSLSQQEIATKLNVNSGRVSEALSGKYHDTH